MRLPTLKSGSLSEDRKIKIKTRFEEFFIFPDFQ